VVEHRHVATRWWEPRVEDPAQPHPRLLRRPATDDGQARGLAGEHDAVARATPSEIRGEQVQRDQPGCHGHVDGHHRRPQRPTSSYLVEERALDSRAPQPSDDAPLARRQLSAQNESPWIWAEKAARDHQRHRKPSAATSGSPVEVVRTVPAQRRPARHRTVRAESCTLLQDVLLDHLAGHPRRHVQARRTTTPVRACGSPTRRTRDARRIDPNRSGQSLGEGASG
jgi:hypothetical protein